MSAAQEDKKRTILDCARRLLVRSGFQDEQVALDDVARAAKVAKGTLFLYYRNKDELFRAAFSDLIETLGAELERCVAEAMDGRARLESVIRIVIEYFDRYRDFLSQAARFPGCRMAENHERMLRVLKACAKDGLFPERDLGFAASALFGLCRADVLYKKLSGGEEALAARVERVAETFLHGAAGRR